MKKQNSRHAKKIRNLILISTLCAVVLTVSTYAWFIGMKTVKVDQFNIDIATTEGLFLSMNGQDWAYNLKPKEAAAYAGATNVWATEDGNKGLIPISSIGDMDSTSSRMKLFEKSSIATTKGGYRLLTSRVNNYLKSDGVTPCDGTNCQQGRGYIAFDLFVKNLSGTEYYDNNDILNEEDIYLTADSGVTVASSEAGGVANTGIENSVRVAFAEIGRVKGTTTDVATITGITCKDTKVDETKVVTGICRDAQIWEPNDKQHESNAIEWYKKSCKQRKASPTGSDVTSANSYDLDADCTTITNGTAYPTYAISRALGTGDNVDVYDGRVASGSDLALYNGYNASTTTYATYKAAKSGESFNADAYKLVDFPYFTDTMKDKTGRERPTFMKLAPNSITKVRVYIYIEGQDIDNYDFASLGKMISVKFGFTKEQYVQSDYPSYNGPDTNITTTGYGTVAQ